MTPSFFETSRPRRRAPAPQRRRRIGWFLCVVCAVALACGSVDSRPLGGAGGGGRADSTHATGGKGGSTGGSRPSSTGGTRAEAADGGLGAENGADAICGDGHRQGSEECDDGNDVSGDGCDSLCETEASGAVCGNSAKEAGEECDDGNLQPGDGCDAQCRKEECGNQRIDAGEQCDPPSSGSCSDHCNRVTEHCGDGIVQTSEGEECDDGNAAAGDGCFECRKECGDGRIDSEAGEQCEPSYNAKGCTTDCHCSASCRWLPTCGDGIVQPERGEQCDPGNGVTCVACRIVTPQQCDGEGGCGGAADGCVPDGTGGPITNGNFDTTGSGWTAGDPNLTAKVVNDGSPAPMALELAFASGPVRAEAGAYECIPVRAGTKYEFEANYRIPSDAPAGVGVAALGMLYSGTQCSGSFLTFYNGPEGLVRDAWTPYSFQIDTTKVSNAPPLRLLLRLDVVRPANVDGSRVRWDSVSLLEPGARCGDCNVDIGEQCDDGNHTAGDGCSADCQIEACGDGLLSANEQCDDGNTKFGGTDTCTPGCRQKNACDTCSASQCKTQLDACFGLTGSAQAGPRAGTARSTLCDELLTCVRTSACDLALRSAPGQISGQDTQAAFMENCYCGTSGDACFDGKANGSCRSEVEAALETTRPTALLGRFDGSDTEYPSFGAVRNLIACQDTSCGTDCAREPNCGDGLIQDRNLNISFVKAGTDVPCDDSLTATGHGCSREECDPPGDGCDQNCLLIRCGNYLTQGDEDCDDGDANGTPGDGCSADCKALYHCGDGILEPKYEQCDPDPNGPPRGGVVCTLAASQSNPDSCACDNKCKLVACGNGIIQTPEQCDPPDGVTCTDSCESVGRTPCEDCIAATASGDGELQATYCAPEPKCLDAERCMIAAKCISPVPGFCYCGTNDMTQCATTTFTPHGPCLDEILAGVEATDNAGVIGQLTNSFDYPAGIAEALLTDVFATAPECHDLCFQGHEPQ